MHLRFSSSSEIRHHELQEIGTTTMAIRKKSLTGTLRPPQNADPAPAAESSSTSSAESSPTQPDTRAASVLLSKRTVSRILLAKRLGGR